MKEWSLRHLPAELRVALIKIALYGITDLSKKIILGKALAKAAPRYHVKFRPNQKNPVA